MAKSSGNLSSRRTLSRNTKPYDANNSFVKKVANKVTDFIPQPSWISKWFNTSQGNGDILNDNENLEEAELEEDIEKPPPSKRPRIRTDITHPPGTFSVRPNTKTSNDKTKVSKEKYSMQNETRDDFLKPSTAGPSGIGHLICSTPNTELDNRPVATQRSDLNLLIPTSNNGTANGLDDNSESSESTSGCSSLIPQTNRQEAPSHDTYSPSFVNRKRFMDEKLTFTNHLQSPRALFVESNSRDSLSSRRPSFNASVMTNTLDRASSLSSPFYNGNTTFGGANAAGLYKQSHSRSLLNSTSDIQLKVPRRTSVQVKPSTTTVDPSGMSQTARKILEALEHFSSPISDAKKIPLKNTSNAASLVNKKRQREENETPSVRVGLRHLTRELTVPTVPDMLKLRRCQKLQDTTVAARKIVSARSGPPPSSQEYRLGSDENENVKYHGKVKAKAKTNLDEEDTVETINLPSVPLPISSLPSFNFTLPQTRSKSLSSKEDNFKFANPIKITDSTQNLKSVNNFTFSNPINAEDHQVLNKSGDSWLLSKPQTSGSNSSSNNNGTLTSNFIWSGSSTAPRPKEKEKHETNSQIGNKVTNDFKTSSVVDILCDKSSEKTSSLSKAESSSSASPKKLSCNENSAVSLDKDANKSIANKTENSVKNTQAASEIWECSECLIRNNISETHCIACKALKPKSNIKVTVSLPTSNSTIETKTTVSDCFGSQFKVSNMQWDCASCSTKNKQTDKKCISCNAQKAESLIQVGTPLITTPKSDPMSKFKPVEGSWECPGCMLRNSATTITCPCCSASKPSSLKVSPKKNKNLTVQGNISNQETNVDTNVSATISNSSQSSNSEIMEKFKPKKDSWECPSCMVRNTDSATVCPCCNTAKPGAKGSQPSEVQKLPPNGFGDKFKKPEGSWSCDTCMVQNQAESLECVSCGSAKPGSAKAKESTSSTSSGLKFNFGIPAGANNFKFGIDKADNQSKSGELSTNNFKFGNTQQSNETGKFVFGIPKEDQNNISKPAVNTDTPKTSECNTGFQFNAKSDKTDANTNLTESEKKAMPFSFGIPRSENSTLSTEKQLDSTVQSPFTFGVNKAEVNASENKKEQKSASENTATEITTSTTNVTNSSFASKVQDNTSIVATTTQNNILESTSNPTFTFNVMKSFTPVSNSSTSTAPNTCLPSYTQHSLTFSDLKAVTQTATTSTPTFGQMVTSSSNATSVPATFSFGTSESVEASKPPAKKINTPISSATETTSVTPQIFTGVSNTMTLFSKSDAKTAVAFGTGESNAPTFTTGESKPALFGTPETKVAVFGSTENKPSIFGATENKMSVFGNAEKSTSVFSIPTAAPAPTPTPAPTFGSRTNNNVLFGSSTPVFGNNTTSNFGSASTSNIFSTTKSNENNISNPSLFTFGAASNQTAPQSGNGFNFSANNNSAGSTQKPLFTFDNNSTRQQSNVLFGGNGFNNAAQTNTPTFTFNAPKPETSTFGQPAVATPLFGVPQNTQNQSTSSFSSARSSNAGFNFGNTATTSGGFNFGGMEPTSTPSGGFNFNASSSAPTVSFDPNTPPSFNFTGGSAPISFNAPRPTGSRKIKKAVRRMRYPGNDSQR